MKVLAALVLPAAVLSASLVHAQGTTRPVTFTCHVAFTSQENGKPDKSGKADLYVTLSLENVPSGFRRIIASHPGSIASFDTLAATSAGEATSHGIFRDVSTSGSWSLNRSLRTADTQEFEQVVINRLSGELFYQKQIADRSGVVFSTRNAFGPCVRKP